MTPIMSSISLRKHPNFKNIDKNVQNADTIYNQIGYAIDNQQYFEKNINLMGSYPLLEE